MVRMSMKSLLKTKNTRIDALTIYLNTDDVQADVLSQSLAQKAAIYRELNFPLILDIQAFASPKDLNLAEVLSVFHQHQLYVVALVHNNPELWQPLAQQHQLHYLAHTNETTPHTIPTPNTSPSTLPTVFIDTPIRTGQQVYAKQADVIITSMVSEGAEIIADGNIHIYAPMRGRALAGANGNTNARIFIHSMQAELVSIAGIYRNFEQNLPDHLHKQAVQVYLQDDRLVIAAING